MICISNTCILFYSKEKMVEIARIFARCACCIFSSERAIMSALLCALLHAVICVLLNSSPIVV